MDVMVSAVAIDWFDADRYCYRCVVDKCQTLTIVIDRDFFAPQAEILELMGGVIGIIRNFLDRTL